MKHSEELEKANEELAKANGGAAENENGIDSINDDLNNVFSEELEDGPELKKSFKLSTGKTFDLDFTKLTGRKLVKIKDQYNDARKKKASFIEITDDTYIAMVAAFGSGKHYDKILDFPVKDFAAIKKFVLEVLSED